MVLILGSRPIKYLARSDSEVMHRPIGTFSFSLLSPRSPNHGEELIATADFTSFAWDEGLVKLGLSFGAKFHKSLHYRTTDL